MEANSSITAPQQDELSNTKAQLLAWMKGGNKTLGWDAIVAFDRATINNTFRQQYIRRFSEANLYPPFSFNKNTSGTLYRYVSGCVFGEPVISFVGANLSDSRAPARVSLELLSGSEITLDYSPEPSALKINALSALGAPVLEMANTLTFKTEPAQVGVITVDLARGENYTLSSGDSSWEKEEFGTMFQSELEKWSAEQRLWIVNRIDSNEGALAIEKVHLRSQPAPGNNLLGAERYGDGAVIALIQMQGRGEGAFPSDQGLRYLIPNDGARFTTSIVLSKERMLLALAYNVFRSDEGWGFLPHQVALSKDQYSGEDLAQITGGVASRRPTAIRVAGGVWVKTWPHGSWHLGTDPLVSGLKAHLKLDSSASGGPNTLTLMLRLDFIREQISTDRNETAWFQCGTFDLTGYGESRVSFALNTDLQTITTSAAEISNYWALGLNGDRFEPRVIAWHYVEAALRNDIRKVFGELLNGIANRSTLLDTFAVRNLLFDGPYVTRMSEVALPHDYIIFGYVAPKVNGFEIKTPQRLVMPGSRFQFEIEPRVSGIRWSVANLPGENEPKGTIDPYIGNYTAPAATDISGRQVRVKVTATKGDATSTALVTILKNTVNVNPRVQYLIANSEGNASCHFSAGALPGLILTWTDPPAAAGTLSNSSNPNRDKMFTAVAREPSKGLEVVRVAVSARGGTENAYVLVKHADAVLAVTARDIDVSQQTVLLEATLASDPAPGVHQWSVLAGSGSIDERGVLTADADPAEPFVFVQIETEPLPGYKFYGYLLLPLPLAPYPERSAASLTTAVLGE